MKKLLLTLLIFIAGCSSNVQLGADEVINEINVDGTMVSIEFTDDNTDEDIIIKSDKKEYLNLFGTFTMYFSVENLTGIKQNIDTVFALKEGDILEVSEYDGYTEEEVIMETPSATSTELGASETIKKIKSKWKSKTLKEATKYKKNKLLGATEFTRKDIKETDSTKLFTDNFEIAEKKFYKASVKIVSSEKEEYFIEAFGVDEGYGHLDPFSYTSDFESPTYSTGDLNGQDSWSGGTNKLDVTSSATCVLNGSQGVIDDGGGYLTRNVTATEGTVYIAMKATQVSSAGDGPFFQARTSVNAYCFFAKISQVSTVNKFQFYTSSGYIAGQTIDLDKWYIVEINIDKDAGSWGEYTFRTKESGGSWTSLSSSYGCGGDCSGGVDQVRIGLDGGVNWGGCFDDISTTDPDPPAPEAGANNINTNSTFFD